MNTVICVRVEHGPPAVASVTGWCIDCSTEVWTSPATVELIGDDGHVICTECFQERLRTDPTPEFGEITLAQLAEIRGYFKSRTPGAGLRSSAIDEEDAGGSS